MNSSTNKKENKKNKRYGIWAWVAALYGPIIFGILIVNLPKVEWKYVFESNKTRVTRHHQKAKEIGLPGIPYWRNSGTAAILYVNEKDVAYCCHFGVIVCVMHLQISIFKTEKWTRNRTSTSDEFI